MKARSIELIITSDGYRINAPLSEDNIVNNFICTADLQSNTKTYQDCKKINDSSSGLDSSKDSADFS